MCGSCPLPTTSLSALPVAEDHEASEGDEESDGGSGVGDQPEDDYVDDRSDGGGGDNHHHDNNDDDNDDSDDDDNDDSDDDDSEDDDGVVGGGDDGLAEDFFAEGALVALGRSGVPRVSAQVAQEVARAHVAGSQ